MSKPEKKRERMDRREAIRWMLGAAAAIGFLDTRDLAGAEATVPVPGGYGTDPNLLESKFLWGRTFSREQLETVSALADVILPRGEASPSASDLGVPDFLDEWISAPYPNQLKDRPVILDGIQWLDAESVRRFEKRFSDLGEAEMTAICDDICYGPEALPEFKEGAGFFSKFRNLTLGAYCTTPTGAKEVGYVGNVALPSFEGPPPEVLKRLKIEERPW